MTKNRVSKEFHLRRAEKSKLVVRLPSSSLQHNQVTVLQLSLKVGLFDEEGSNDYYGLSGRVYANLQPLWAYICVFTACLGVFMRI